MNLAPEIKQGIVALAKKYGLQQVVLFGSRARGEGLSIVLCKFFSLMFDVVDLDRPVQAELLASIRRDGIALYHI